MLRSLISSLKNDRIRNTRNLDMIPLISPMRCFCFALMTWRHLVLEWTSKEDIRDPSHIDVRKNSFPRLL